MLKKKGNKTEKTQFTLKKGKKASYRLEKTGCSSSGGKEKKRPTRGRKKGGTRLPAITGGVNFLCQLHLRGRKKISGTTEKRKKIDLGRNQKKKGRKPKQRPPSGSQPNHKTRNALLEKKAPEGINPGGGGGGGHSTMWGERKDLIVHGDPPEGKRKNTLVKITRETPLLFKEKKNRRIFSRGEKGEKRKICQPERERGPITRGFKEKEKE